MSKIRPEQARFEHPFIEDKDIKSFVCLTWRPNKTHSKFAHVAGRVGCEDCHPVGYEICTKTITPSAAHDDLMRAKVGLQMASLVQGAFSGGRG